MKIEYDVPVDKIDSNNTTEYTQALKDFLKTDKDNMLLDFDNDIKGATRCQARLVMFVGRNNLYDRIRIARRKAKVYVIREGKI
jgi:hypothetical protein